MTWRRGLQRMVLGAFQALARWAIRRPRTTLTLATVVTLAAAPGVLRLQLRTDGHALVSPEAPEVLYDEAVREAFDIRDEIVVAIRSDHPDGIYNPETLQLVRELTAEFKKLPGLRASDVTSLATEPGFRVRPGTLIREKLLEPPLTTRAELDRLREDLGKIQIYTGTLVSYDGKATAILLGAPPAGDRIQAYARIQQLLAARGLPPEKVAVTGAPVAEALLGINILEDLGVPQTLLGATTRSGAGPAAWKWPSSFYEVRFLIAHKAGLLPLAVLVMALVFLASFRNLLATLLPLQEVGAVLLVVFGLMGWFGVPIYLTIAVMPVLLTAMCVTDEIHLFSRYFALLRAHAGAGHVDLVRRTVDELCGPVVNTSLTTAAGFVSFALSPLRPVQAFGVFTAVGVLLGLLYSLTVIPALLVLIDPRRFKQTRRAVAKRSLLATAPWFERLAPVVVRYRGWVVGVVLAVTALAPLGLRKLVVQDSWVDGFDPASEFRRATDFVNQQFHGMHLLLVSFELTGTNRGEIPAASWSGFRLLLPTNLVQDAKELAGAKITLAPAEAGPALAGDPPPFSSHIEMLTWEGSNLVAWLPVHTVTNRAGLPAPRSGRWRFESPAQTHLRPQTLRLLGSLADFLRQRRDCQVGGVLGPADYVATSRFMVRPAEPGARAIPDHAGEVKLMWDYYRIARGPERLRQVVNTNYDRSLTLVFLKDGNFIDTARLMRHLRAYEREHLAPHGAKLGFAGDVAVSQSLISGIVRTQMQSLVGALAGVCLLVGVLGPSLRWGFYCVVPSALAVVLNFALMGGCGIPLGVATTMFAGMTLGIGVDFAIHLVEGYRLVRAGGGSAQEALGRSLALTGPPVLVNTLAISLGFGVMLLSQVPANARLGALLVLALGNCLIASLLLLPALLHWRPPEETRASRPGTTTPAGADSGSAKAEVEGSRSEDSPRSVRSGFGAT